MKVNRISKVVGRRAMPEKNSLLTFDMLNYKPVRYSTPHTLPPPNNFTNCNFETVALGQCF